jgi:hypothetical protein
MTVLAVSSDTFFDAVLKALAKSHGEELPEMDAFLLASIRSSDANKRQVCDPEAFFRHQEDHA